MVGHKSSSASPSSWILASNVLISSRRKNNHVWESNCYIYVLMAMLRCLLCKSCTCWKASYCPNTPGRLKLGLGCMLVEGPEREESCPLFSHRAPQSLQLVPACAQGRLVLWSGWMGRSDGRAAGDLARVPGSAWEMLWLQLARASRMLLHPVPKCQSKEEDGMDDFVLSGAAFPPLALHAGYSLVSVTWWQSRGWVP